MLSKNQAQAERFRTRRFNQLLKAFIFLSIFALSFINKTNAPHTPAMQVITELRCNEGSGTTTADASGNGHNATLSGATWVAGKYGQGLGFNGTSNYASIPDHADFTLTPTQSYTWSAWVKNNNFNQWSPVWSQTLNTSNFFYFYAHTSNDAEAGPVTNGISVYWYSGNSKLVIHSNNNVLTAGQWSYIAVTYDASQTQANRFTIYVNGTNVTNKTDVVSSGTLAAIDPNNIRIGSDQPFSEFLNGSIDEVRYYRRLLTVAEIQSDMNIGNTTDTTPPSVNITAPAAGNVSGTLNVTANASDNVGVVGVQFKLDGVNLGAEDLTSPYSVSWNTTTATTGTHSLTAMARDAAGNTTTSSTISVNVNNTDATPPSINITAPAAGNVSGTINVTATASDNIGVAGVQFKLDGVNLGAEDLTSPYSISWNTTTATSGIHNLTAVARDAAGNTTTSSTIIVSVNNTDATPPSVNITAPAAGNVSGTLNVTATASDNVGVVGVQFILDGTNLGTEDLTSPYSVSWNTTTLANGSHTLTAKARDAAGNTTTSAAVNVNVNNDTQAPAISVDAPLTSTVSGTINVTATASDNVGVVGVQFLLDGSNLGTEDLTSPYSVSWNTTTASNGVHSLTAKARDAAGNATTSVVTSFNVFNNNLVAAYGFNENTGTIVNDNSGNGNTGTLTNGPTWSASGKFGAAILFDGSNDFVNIADANSLDLTNGMTIEAWVNPSNLTGYKTVVCKENGTNNLAYTLSANNSTSGATNQRPDSRIRIGNNTRTVTGTTKLALNTWTHLATTYDGTTMRLYVNGVQVSTFATTGNITATTNPLRIGGSTALGAQYFTGLIDEVRIYNKAITAAQIQTDMNTPIAPDVTAPTVNITAPAAGNVSGTLNVTANASDNIAVAGVQFLLNGNPLGSEDLTSPYSVSWNTTTLANGNYTLTAKARDAAGNTTTSSDVIVTVNNDTQVPTVTLTAPSTGTIAGAVNVTADANDNTGVVGVQFLLNGNNLGTEDLTAPYSISWNTTTVADGNYTLTAKARDAAGNTTTSTGVVVNVLNHPPDTEFPTINISAPTAGNVVGTINVTATASDNVGVIGVQFLLNGNPLGSEDLTSPYSVSWNTTTLANGDYVLTAKARDAAGNITTSDPVTVTVNNPVDTQLPTAAITAPTAGNVAGTVTITATATDNVGVVGVQFLVDGFNLGTEDLTAPYSVSWNTTTTVNGAHTLTVKARDAAGNVGVSQDVVVNVNNDVQAPTINIASPTGGNVSGTINVTATATDNIGVVGVQFVLDGVNFGAESLTAPYSVSWNTTTVTNGNHTLTAKARDAAGNTSSSNPVTVIVNNATNLLTAINFNEGTGTTAADVSGKNHNGTLSGATWVAGKYGQAVSFNGTSNYVNIADHDDFTLTPTQSYTWSAWVKNTNFHEWGCVWSQTVSNTNFFYFYAHTSNDGETGPITNGVSVHWYNGSNKLGIHSTNNVLTAGQWSYITITYNGGLAQASRFTIYVNGIDVTDRSDVVSTGTIAALNPTNIRVGSDQPFAEFLAGSVDDVRYYNRLLTPAEIQNDMITPVGNDNTPPVINISSPADGASLTGTINVTANASDNAAVAGVQFLLDGNNLGTEDITSPYSISWNTTTITNGSHILTARARDASGNTTTANPITVIINNDAQPPTVSITSPQAGTIDSILNITADASDNVDVIGVQFLLNGNPLGAEVTTEPYLFNWNTNTVADGSYTLTAKARDAAGNSIISASVVVNVLNHPPDLLFPTVNITAPAAGNVVGTVNITANANDNVGVVGVQFLLNGNPLGAERTTAPYSITWNTLMVANGDYVITAKARDAAGNITTSDPVTLTVNNPPDTDPPTINITAPAAGNVVGTVTITATAIDNSGTVARVQFLLDGNPLGSEDLAAPYSITWNTLAVTNGIHILTATAHDGAGNIGTSADVTVTVNNDHTNPTVTITAPAAGTVAGIVTITANANDNIGVAGVQFLLDGNNLGAEDLTAPYSVQWNTGLLGNGNHVLSARARDTSGNTALASNVNVTIFNNNPVISAVTVTSITPTSAVISWTTNVATTSQVNYGTTASYGLYTLVDSTLVTSHSQTLNSLSPGTQYHYQVASGNGTLATSPDNTFSAANMPASIGTLNGHSVFADATGKIIPWTPNPTDGYTTVITLAWNWLLNSVPNDPSTGKPAYYSRSYLDVNTQAVENWPHNPAGLYGMMTESAMKYYNYTGNANVMQIAENVTTWHLDHGMTLATDSWASVPYSSGDAGSLTYDGANVGNGNGQGDGDGFLEPDKIGELGFAWLKLYKYDGNTRYRDAAIQAGKVLSAKVRTGTVSQSPWPFRVNAHTGVVFDDYCADVIGPISLLDGLIASGLGDTASYRVARNIAWNWMMTYPMVNNVWAQYFEDVGTQSPYSSNVNQYDAMMTARYLLEHPELDPNWEAHVRGLIAWVETTFGGTQFGATIINEQKPIFPYPMGSHTSRYASVNALLYEKTGDLTAKEKAFRAFNWATYMAKSTGVVIDGPAVNNQWFTDGYCDYVRHFVTGMGAVPEWVPFNQTHLLRSTSITRNVVYGTNSLSYTTYDNTSTDVVHVNFNPAIVSVDGVALPQRSDLSQPGWTLDITTKTLRIYHTSGTQISISASAPPSGRMFETNPLYTNNNNQKAFEYTRKAPPPLP